MQQCKSWSHTPVLKETTELLCCRCGAVSFHISKDEGYGGQLLADKEDCLCTRCC
jgi:hypothetical protein